MGIKIIKHGYTILLCRRCEPMIEQITLFQQEKCIINQQNIVYFYRKKKFLDLHTEQIMIVFLRLSGSE